MASSDLLMAFQLLSEKLDAERLKIEEEAAEAKRKIKMEQDEMQAKRLKLESDIEKFEQDVRSFQEEKDALMFGQQSDVLELNIGGQKKLAVLRSTLCAFPESMLAANFSGRWDAQLAKDNQGSFFIDFSPDVFEPLVNYLREVKLSGPLDTIPWGAGVPQDSLRLFGKMAEYYGVPKVSYDSYVCSRFGSSGGLWAFRGKTDYIDIEVDYPITLRGLQMFGPYNCSKANYEGTIRLYKSGDLVLTEDVKYSVAQAELHAEMFKNPLQMEANTLYTIALTIAGPDAVGGSGGSNTVNVGGTKFTFWDTASAMKKHTACNNTNVSNGQIPGLIFSGISFEEG